jgi:hypothetical protein
MSCYVVREHGAPGPSVLTLHTHLPRVALIDTPGVSALEGPVRTDERITREPPGYLPIS